MVWKARAEGIVQNAPHLNIVAVKTIKGIVSLLDPFSSSTYITF